MKNNLIILFFCSIIFTLNAQIQTPAASPSATITQQVGLSTVTLSYSRPSLKGRKMMGSNFVPYDQVWRTGANQIPNLKLADDVVIEGQKVAAGTYGIFTIPTATDWTVILSKNPNQWGAYEYKQSEDLLRFTVKSTKLKESVEHFTMEFTDFTPTSAHMAIRWENVQVKFNIKQEVDEKIMADIKAKTSASEVKTETYMGAADYYFETNRDINQALAWADKVVEKEKEYWTYYLRAKIAAKAGKCNIAVEDATKGLELAKKANDGGYVTNLSKVLKSCGK